MKKEDLNRLKSVCEKEGFELLNPNYEDNDKFFVIAKKKYIWEGVHFGKVAEDYSNGDYIAGKIYPVTGRDGNYIITLFDEEGDSDNGLPGERITPSTEEAYFEQLKAEAFKRFGEIKIGNRFTSVRVNGSINTIDNGDGFRYFRGSDILIFNGWAIYESGKWAEKVKDRIKVEVKSGSISTDLIKLELKITGSERKPMYEAHSFIRKQLEKYLNDEI